MADRIRTNDPKGRTVTCSNDCWENHVLKARSWMAGYEKRVERAIASPTAIMRDADFPDRECYYLLKSSKNYVKVVVSFDTDGRGSVVTALVSDSIKSGEVLIWAK